jgi:hypothetical protein
MYRVPFPSPGAFFGESYVATGTSVPADPSKQPDNSKALLDMLDPLDSFMGGTFPSPGIPSGQPTAGMLSPWLQTLPQSALEAFPVGIDVFSEQSIMDMDLHSAETNQLIPSLMNIDISMDDNNSA